MRVSRILSLLAVLALVPALAACDGADPDDNDPNCASGTLTASAAGQAFAAECISFSFEGGVLAIGGITNLDGSDGATQRQINLTIPGAQAGQTYAFGPGGSTAVATYADVSGTNPDPSAVFTANLIIGSGSITVDAVSASGARGTFRFTARNSDGQTVTVSNGSFDVGP